MTNHAEESIAYYEREYARCRHQAIEQMLFALGGGAEWNANGELDNCSSEGPRERWYPEGKSREESEAFHGGNDDFERAYYTDHQWTNWTDHWSPDSLHISHVPDNVTDDWLRVCIEACQAYLDVPDNAIKMSVSFDYSGVEYDDEGKQIGEMKRVMEPWMSEPRWKGAQHKPAIKKILERLLAIAASRGILITMKQEFKVTLTREELLDLIRKNSGNVDIPEDAQVSVDTGECYAGIVDTHTPLEIKWSR